MARAVRARKPGGWVGPARRVVAWMVLLAVVGPGPSLGAEPDGGELASFRRELNVAWVVAAGCLALAMKAGFALAETGLVRAKNAAQTAALKLGMFAVTVLGFWLCGFAWMFGGQPAIITLPDGPAPAAPLMASVTLFGQRWDLAGLRGFGLGGPDGQSPAILAVFFFHAILLDVAATVPTGAMLERWRFASALIFGFVASALIVPVYGAWVWGGGWLSGPHAPLGLGTGVVDFAGSGVIHLTGGVMALAGSLALGPRIGKSNSDGTSNAIPGHNVPLVVVGTMILVVAWFGPHLGRTFSAFSPAVAPIAIATLLAAGAGCLTALGMTKWVYGKPDPTMGCNGLLAGLVAISASCPFVTPAGAILVGGLAGILAVASILFLDKTLRIDDPVGAISVHGVCGAFGLLCVGIFAGPVPGPEGELLAASAGRFEGASLAQFGAQVVGVLANLAWVFPTSLAGFALINRLVGNRVAARAEIEGLDVPEMGVLGYVGEETYAVRTAGQDFLATFGPGVPPKAAAKPVVTPMNPSKPRRPKV